MQLLKPGMMLTRRRLSQAFLMGGFASTLSSKLVKSESSGVQPIIPASSFAAQGTKNVIVSPNGDTLAWVETLAQRNHIIIMGIDGSRPVVSNIPVGYRPRSLLWFTNEKLLLILTFSSTPRWADAGEVFEFERLLIVSRDGVESKLLTPGGILSDNPSSQFENTGGQSRDHVVLSEVIYDATRDVSKDSRIQVVRDGIFRQTIFTVDTKTGRKKEVVRGEPSTVNWVFDKNGLPRMRIDLDGETGTCTYRTLGSFNSLTLVKTYQNIVGGAPLVPYGMLDEHNALFIDKLGERSAAVSMDIRTGVLTPAFPQIAAPIGDILFDPHTRQVVGLVSDAFIPEIYWIDPVLSDLSVKLKRAFPAKKITFTSWSADRGKIIVLVEDDTSPVARYLFDSKSLQATPITGEIEGFEENRFGDKKLTSFTARDGQAISGWLTLPLGGSSANKPLVVLPHGGPAAHDESGFDYFAQFLASRGYHVLQPQFRGSTGFGRAFQDAGIGQWGAKMQEDITDGVMWAVAQDYAKLGNIAIVGGSYGGYAALAGATMTPELYKCAVSINGVSSLGAFQGYGYRNGNRRSNRLAYWEYHMGFTRFDRSQIEALSPVFLANRTNANIMLIHGTDDIIVPIAQSRTMAKALQTAGKAHQLIELVGEDHFLSLMNSRVRVLEEIERFLAANLKA